MRIAETMARVAIIQPGAWLRQCRDYGGDFGHYIANNWKNDVLEPLVIEHVTECVQRLMGAELERETALANDEADTIVLIDGYPRSVREAEHAAESLRATLVHFEYDNTGAADSGATDSGATDAERSLLRQRATDRQRGSDDSVDAFDKRFDHYCDTKRVVINSFAPERRRIVPYCDSTAPEICTATLATEILGSADSLRCTATPIAPPKSWLADRCGQIPHVFERVTERERATVIQQQQRLAGRARAPRQFCGTHPVSLNRDNMRRILRYPYLVAVKADGVRYACVVRDHGRLYFVNRRLDVYRLRDHPPTLSHSRYDDTLLDGELCAIHDALLPGGARRGTFNYGSGHSAAVYLVLDVFSWCGTNVMRAPLIERLSHSVPLGRDMFSASLPFRPQEYVDRTQIKQLRDRAHTLPFSGSCDGYILVPARLPMRVGTDYNLFKYKPLLKNTVDVLYDNGTLYIVKTSSDDTALEQQELGGVSVPADDVPAAAAAAAAGAALAPFLVGALHSSFATNSDAFASGTILECAPKLAPDGSIAWIPVRIRGGDKSLPNADWVAASVVDSVRDNITETELIEYAQRPSVSPASVPSPPRVVGSKRARLSDL